MNEEIPTWAKDMAHKIDRIDAAVCGPENNPEKGLLMRVHMMEGDIDSAKKLGWAGALGAFGAIGAAIVGYWKHGGQS